jgi:hypothetical protein
MTIVIFTTQIRLYFANARLSPRALGEVPRRRVEVFDPGGRHRHAG